MTTNVNRNVKTYVAFLALLTIIVPSISMAQEVTAVPSVDLSRYVGKWYEIARFPNSFQKACTGNVTAQYRSRADGKIDVINRCKKNDGSVDEAVGLARVSNDSGSATNSRLKVRFAPEWLSWLPLVWGDYWVLDLAPDYSYAVVGEPGRKYLWVLSRTPKLTDSTYRAALAKVAAQGFDVSKLVKTPQE